MKLKTLIKKLQKLEKENGNVEVMVDVGFDFAPIAGSGVQAASIGVRSDRVIVAIVAKEDF